MRLSTYFSCRMGGYAFMVNDKLLEDRAMSLPFIFSISEYIFMNVDCAVTKIMLENLYFVPGLPMPLFH